MYTIKYYLAIKKNKILPCAATWMNLEGIMLSELSQTEKDKYYMISHVKSKIQQISECNRKRNRHRYREQTSGYQWEGWEGQ